MSNQVVVIGGGAAGMFAAITASEKNNVILIEKNDKVGKKLRITGKGRCNVTNYCDPEEFLQHVTKNSKFLYSAIYNFSAYDTMSFFEENGLKLKVERGNRVFPKSDRAADVVDLLHNLLIEKNVNIINDSVIDILVHDNVICGVKLYSGKVIDTEKVILCTGGLSYPLTGSTGDGYRFAKKLGHTIEELLPSLVALESKDWFCSKLQGLSLKNSSIRVVDSFTNKEIYYDFGEMLFTHFGVSGPMILSASAHMRKMPTSRYSIIIDLKPALDFDTLDKRLIKELEINNNKDLINSFDSILPKSLIPIVIKRCGMNEHQKCHTIDKKSRHMIVDMLKNFTIDVCGFRPVSEAIITSGGINIKEVNPGTMESKIVKGLFFAGEVLDLDAYTGGYNLQIAFSTARLAGENV